MDGRSDVSRGNVARQLLEDDVMKDAFAAAETSFVEEWKQSEDPRRREIAWAKVQGLEEIRRQLRKIVSTGEFSLDRLSKGGSQQG